MGFKILAAVIAFSASAIAAPPSVDSKLAKAYPGNCTPDGQFCAHFAPTEIPVHALASYIRSAKKSIRIATYNMDVKEFTELLREKMDQGVKVEFGLDFKHSVGHGGVWAALGTHPNLTKFRLPVFRGSNPQMHNKIFVIDNHVVLYGSANFTYSGLVANYENVLAIRNPGVIQKFNDELDELKRNALAACGLFASPVAACTQGQEKWDPMIEKLLVDGTLPKSVVNLELEKEITLRNGERKVIKVCDPLTEKFGGLLGYENTPRVSLKNCVTDAALRDKLIKLSQAIRESERYSDGTLTSSVRRSDKDLGPEAPVEVYFGPEDNIEAAALRELDRALANPKDSFVLVSTNFITNAAIAKKLVELYDKNVVLKVFFDRGRIEDPNFQQQVRTLTKIGIIKFDNSLTGPYGSNHNKMAVVGVGKTLTLLNGSANWSAAGVNRNDENMLVIRNQEIAAIYTREILSQLYVYGYGHGGAGYDELVNFIQARVPCMKTLLSGEGSCKAANGATWKPEARSSAVLSLGSIPLAADERVWVWVRQVEEQTGIKALPLFNHETFAGRWLTAVPMPLNWDIQFKFFKVPKNYDPNKNGIPDNAWEDAGPDRTLRVAPTGVHVIRSKYEWGTR